MSRQVQQVLETHHGLIVIGSSGNDVSVRKLISLAQHTKYLYWCVYKEEEVNFEVRKLLYEKDGRIVRIDGFDKLMEEIRQRVKIERGEIQDELKNRANKLDKELYKFDEEYSFAGKEGFEFLDAIFEDGNERDRKFIMPYFEFVFSNPTRTTIHSLFARIFTQNPELRKRGKDYLQAFVRSAPENAGANALYGTFLLFNEPKNPDAEKYLKKAVDLKPHEGQHYYNLASLYEVTDRPIEALKMTQKAYDNGWQVLDVFLQFATLHKGLGHIEESKRYAEMARERINDDDYYDSVCIHAILGNKKEALDSLERAIEQEPYRREWARKRPGLGRPAL